tara:strand:- start:1211 stop:1543 length:333 start_codon:yes stop_codon:yes gene_type:complete
MLLKKTHLLEKVKEFLNIKEEVDFNKNKISNLCKELEDIKKSIDDKDEKISNLNKTIVKLESQNKLITNDIVIISAALKDLYTILLKEYGYSESDIFEFFNLKKKKIDYH